MKLQYMEEKLPGLFCDLKIIQKKVDNRLKYGNVATIGGCATYIAGGAMIVGGIVAAPFTLGASVGLTATGTVVAAGGGITTTGAKSINFVSGKLDLKRINKMVNEFWGH